LRALKDSDVPALALLSVLWLGAALVIDPSGEFPVVDDWAYAQSVQALIEGRGFLLSDWTAANLASQVLWGAGFASIFGYSMTVLRWSTLVLGLLGGLAIFRLFRLSGVARETALLGALVSIFNPLYFALAFSFMSDVPYTAMQFIAMWLIAEGVIARGPVRQALGWCAALAALLCRQIGLFIPLAFAAEAISRRPWNARRILFALGLLAAFALVQFGYVAWLDATDRTPLLFARQVTSISAGLAAPGEFIALIFTFATLCFFYLGLFALPLTLACVPAWSGLLSQRWRWPAFIAIGLLSAAIFAHQAATGFYFPMWVDTLNTYNGVGAADDAGTPLPQTTRIILTALASLGGVLLLPALAGAVLAWRRAPRASAFDVPLFAAVVALATLGSIALILTRFDRYLISAIPCVLLALSPLLTLPALRRAGIMAGFATLAMMGLVTIGATHDYLAFKRTHWQAYARLAQCVPTDRINAGWVANGASNFGRYGNPLDFDTWYESPDYLVRAARRKRGYAIVETHPVERWLPWSQDAPPVLVLKSRSLDGADRALPDGRRLQRCLHARPARRADHDHPVRSGGGGGARRGDDSGLQP
jgi:hypothetical protein